MGRFQIKKIEKRVKNLKKEKERRIKLSLQTRPLLEPIPNPPTKKHPLEDGILLFGKHRGEKVLSLLRGYESSAYVLDYLAKSPDLPKDFRKQIDQILENSDPFEDSPINSVDIEDSPSGLTVREINIEDDDQIPW